MAGGHQRINITSGEIIGADVFSRLFAGDLSAAGNLELVHFAP
jgi:hypothetical protein